MSQQQQQTAIAARPKEQDITGNVLTKIQAFQESGELQLPKDYSAANALKSAWLILQETKDRNNKPALEVCTKESIANALLKMVVWGLSPLKKQCDFIVYGTQLSCDPEYTGNIALAKRFGGLKDIKANAIFEGDEFVFEVDTETGRRKLVKHAQSLENYGSGNVKGAYAVLEFTDGTRDIEIMNMKQIQAAWNQGGSKGNSGAHKNFPDQMACKTVINRACKLIIRSSDDSALIEQNDEERAPASEAVKQTIAEKANRKELSFEEAVIVKDPEPVKEQEATNIIQPNEQFENSEQPKQGEQVKAPF